MRPATGCTFASAAVARSKGTPETSIVVRTPSRLDTLKRPSKVLSMRASPQELSTTKAIPFRETAVAGAVQAAPGEHSGELHSLHVVHIEHGVLELRHFEQALLRARVVLHVAVIIEVIAREIGEQSG